jgi:uncharacterized protein (DUF2236 family)
VTTPISHRINGERLIVLGWSRAILLQLAHPLIAAGVFEHSGFRASPLAAVKRLHHTTRAMLAISFGDDQRRNQALDGIRAIHTRVNGTLRETVGPWPAGTPYSAEDPALLLWVHATLAESMVVTYETLVAPISPAERDAYCDEGADASIALGVRPDQMPHTWAALQDYLARTYAGGAIAVGPQALELADALLRTSIPPILGPVGTLSRTLTAGLLPPRIREAYGLRWTEADRRRYARSTSALRTLRKMMPEIMALWPDARRRRTPVPTAR